MNLRFTEGNRQMSDEYDQSPLKMSDELKVCVERMTPFQRKYCEFRSRGLKQADASKKAGSEASTREALGRVGYNTENLKGSKEYILFLQESRARASMIDEYEVLEKIKAVFTEALAAGNYNAANKSAELLGLSLGMFNKNVSASKKIDKEEKDNKNKNNTNAFKEDDDEDDYSPTDRLKKVQEYMKDLNVLPKE